MAKKNSNRTSTRKEEKKVSVKPTNGKGAKKVKKVTDNFSKKELIDTFRMMLLARAIDQKAMNFLRQGKTFFHIAGAGHEAD